MFHLSRQFLLAIVALFLLFTFALSAAAQFPTPTPEPPLTSQELVRLVYQLPKNPDLHDEVVDTVRKRGIAFPLTDGMRTLVAAKSGNDAVLRRTLEEAERRRANPKTETVPPLAEANDVLDRSKNVTLAAANAMPDFIVRQLIKRSVAYGKTANWQPQDTLTIGVSYRQTAGEEYKVLAVNGIPPGPEVKQGGEYGDYVGGSSSTGEYVTGLASLFKDESRTTFRMLDTDVLRGHKTIVYEFEVQLPYSSLTLKAGKSQIATVGSRGRVWIEREQNRVLRFEQIATDIPGDFPIRAASSTVDYDWVTINERPYLLPIHADILITSLYKGAQLLQSKNDIRFRSYQKFGSELKIVEEVDDDTPPEKPDETKKPDQPGKP